MTACPACGSESLDASTHCVHCGAALSPAAEEAPGHTSHFGDQDVKKLVARIAREEEAAQDGDGNLLAGLPRPKASSMVSPLRGGQTSASTRGGRPEQRRARSASGSTVMGMPLYTTGEQGAIRPVARRGVVSMPAADASGVSASIQSLDAFQGDIGSARRPDSTPPGAVGAGDQDDGLGAAGASSSAGAAAAPVGAASSDGAGSTRTGAAAPVVAAESRAEGTAGVDSRPGTAADPKIDRDAAPARAAADAPARVAADAPARVASDAPARPDAHALGGVGSPPAGRPVTTATRPLELSRPASSTKTSPLALIAVVAVVIAIVAFFALR
jgi:hypothetical protein